MSMQSTCSDARRSPENETRRWSDIPPEILDIIKYKVVTTGESSTNIISSICKEWNTSNLYAFPADFSPLLIYKNKMDAGSLNYYSPLLNKTFIVPCPFMDISNTVLRHASNGWLLLSQGDFKLFLINPFTGTIRNLQEAESTIEFTVCAFSTPPPLPPSPLPNDFMIFGMSCLEEDAVLISLYAAGKWVVKDERYGCSYPFILSECTPVYHNGLFYCLDVRGKFGTFNPKGNKWMCLEKPYMVRYYLREDDVGQCSHLAELNGQLIGVCLEHRRMKISIFKLDEEEMEWVKWVNCSFLDDMALFVGYPLSIFGKVKKYSMSNNVFFTTLYGDEDVYEADVKMFEGRMFFVPKYPKLVQGSERRGIVSCPFANKDKPEFKKSRELLFSIWMVPLVPLQKKNVHMSILCHQSSEKCSAIKLIINDFLEVLRYCL